MNDDKIQKIETENFGKIILLETIEKLFSTLSFLSSFDDEIFGYIGWRGQASIDWKIESKAVRRLKSYHPTFKSNIDNLSMLNYSLLEYENKLLQGARQRGHSLYFGRELNDLELLSIIQHYGGSTRLLDFSKSAWVALWFACTDENYKEQNGLLTMLNIDRLSESTTHIREGLSFLKIDKILEVANETPVLYEPPHLIPRMRNQHSFFLFGKIVNEKWGSLPDFSSKSLTHIAISPKLKEQLNMSWKALFGFSESFIYDDIEGYSQSHNSNKPFSIKDISFNF